MVWKKCVGSLKLQSYHLQSYMSQVTLSTKCPQEWYENVNKSQFYEEEKQAYISL